MHADAPAKLPSDDELRAMRARTGRWIILGWSSFILVFTTAWFTLPRIAPIPEPVDRLLLAVQLTVGPALVMTSILQGLMRMSDTLAAEDPFLAAESHAFKVNQRVMTNTAEQALIFIPTYLALAVRMDPDQSFLLPLLMGFWCFARVIFWIGYRIGNHVRAPGMDWTMGTAFTTLVLLGMSFF